MTEQPIVPQQPDPLAKQTDALVKIEGHLKSIRGMLQFFVVIAILGIIAQACSVLGLM